MSEKLKYVMIFNHPGRSECTHAALWGLIGDLTGLMGTNRIERRLGTMGAYRDLQGVMGKHGDLIGLSSLQEFEYGFEYWEYGFISVVCWLINSIEQI